MDASPEHGVPLSEFLTGLSRPELASDDMVYEALEAGADIIEQALDHDAASPELHPFLAFLSRGSVVRAINARGNLRAEEHHLKYRWDPSTDYVKDLIAYLRFRRGTRSFPARLGLSIIALMQSVPSPALFVRSVAKDNQAQLYNNPLFRLQLLAAAMLGSPRSQVSAPDMYEQLERQWLPFFAAFFERHKRKMRPGVTTRDLVDILVAVGEGLALRELIDRSVEDEHQRRVNLQGTTALTLIFACTVPTDEESPQTLDQLVNHELIGATPDVSQSSDVRSADAE